MKIFGKRAARVWHAATKITAEDQDKVAEEAKAEVIRRVQEEVLSSRKAMEAMENLKAILQNELSDLESENQPNIQLVSLSCNYSETKKNEKQ